MCQHSTTVAPVVGKIEFGPEQRAEIDYRIGAKLMEREMFRSEYVRGLTDAFYWLAIFAMLAYAAYIYFKAED